MVFATIKKAYFIVATVMTSVVMIGGFTVVIRNSSESITDWAKELIMICLALWVPSPVDFVEKSVNDAKNELLGINEISNHQKNYSCDSSENSQKQIDTLTKKAINAVMKHVDNHRENQSELSSEQGETFCAETQLANPIHQSTEKKICSDSRGKVADDSQLSVVVEIV